MTQRIGTGIAINADLEEDLLNPMEIGESRARLRTKAKQRCTSTFSTYYLNEKAKDMASLASIDIERDRALTVMENNIFEEDQSVIDLKADKDKETKIQEMVSYKSELKSLIGNLQHVTQD